MYTFPFMQHGAVLSSSVNACTTHPSKPNTHLHFNFIHKNTHTNEPSLFPEVQSCHESVRTHTPVPSKPNTCLMPTSMHTLHTTTHVNMPYILTGHAAALQPKVHTNLFSQKTAPSATPRQLSTAHSTAHTNAPFLSPEEQCCPVS